MSFVTGWNPEPMINGGGGGGGGTVTSVTASAPLTSSGGATPNIALVIPGETRGDLLYRDATGWTRLPLGAPGDVLSSDGTDAVWTVPGAGFVPTSRTINTVNGITGGGDLSADRTLTIGFAGETQGDVMFRGAANWQRLAPGTAGQLLTSGGPAANPSWTTVSTTTLGAVPTTRTITTTNGITGGGDLSANRTFTIGFAGEAQGDVMYRDAANWARLAAGTSGFFLMTGGAGANPSWADPNSGAFMKPTARAVAIANVATLSGAATIDGVVLATGDVLLLVAQSTAANNGPWVVNTAGAWTRPTWFDTSAKVTLGHIIAVREGTLMARSGWYLTNITAPTLGVTSLTYDGRAPVNDVVSALDNSNLLTWRRLNAGTLYRLISADSAGNVTFGDTSVAATLVVGNNDIRLSTTAGAGNDSSNIGISNTAIVFNMASGISAIDTVRLNSTPLMIVGQRENTTAAVPLLVPIRGSQPASTQSNTAASGLELGTGAGRGTSVSTGVLTGFESVASGTTLQTTKHTVFTWTGTYIRQEQGGAVNYAAVAGGNVSATVLSNWLVYTSIGTAIVTLPAANAVPKGWSLRVVDGSATASAGTPITVQRAGADTINAPEGAAGVSVKIQSPAMTREFISDGVSLWFATGEY